MCHCLPYGGAYGFRLQILKKVLHVIEKAVADSYFGFFQAAKHVVYRDLGLTKGE